MVQLTVKGTTHPDEFIVHAACTDLAGDLAQRLVTIQNARHRLRLQLYSVHELIAPAKAKAAVPGNALEQAYERINARLRDPKAEVHDAEAQEGWDELRTMVKQLFPEECTHKDGDAAAVDALYAKHDDPDIDEEYRLRIYHLRACLDPKNHSHEHLPAEQAALFFCGRQLDDASAIGSLCANNDKSRVTVKLGRAGGAAPSKEPRINYEEQRKLRELHLQRAEEFKQLEESELRDRVVKKARPSGLALAAAASSSSSSSIGVSAPISMSVNRHIFDNSKSTMRDADE